MYPEGEALLLTQVKAATGFSAVNCTRGDWRFLNRENIIAGAVIRPDPFTIGYGEGRVDYTWGAVVEVWRKYVDDGTTLTNLEADVKAIINRLILYPHFQDTTNQLTNGEVYGGDGVVMIPPPPQGPHWLMQALNVRWLEQINTTYSE